MGVAPIRLTVVATHPVQYATPWFRFITDHCPEIDLTVVYASRPSAAQQGTGFDRAFEWDLPLLEGYRSTIVRESRPGDAFASGSFHGLDVPEVVAAMLDTRPDVVLIPGWHSITQVRAIRAARQRGIPVLYRGDSHLGLAPKGWRRAAWSLRTRARLRMYRGYLAVGSRSREYLRAHGAPPTAIYASPHAVDNGWFAASAAPHLTAEGRAQARAEYGACADDFVVLFAGKLARSKRPMDALRAVQRLGSGALLVVAGAGELEGDLRAEADRLGVRAAWPGFINQSGIARAYAAADCLVLPSESESWGLVVNEGMATGLPAIVSDRSGCAPDLVSAGVTGETFHTGDVDDLVAALERVRARGGRSVMGDACRQRASAYDFAAASTGLVAACQSVAPSAGHAPRVLACCGGMVVVSGLERMTFEVLRIVRESGGAVHCIVNSWENHRIVPRLEQLGASWSTGYYWFRLTKSLNPIRQAQSVWDVLRTSAGLVMDAWRFRPTHVLVADYGAVLRNAPVLPLLRLLGVKVVFRVGNAPERGRGYDLLWRHVLRRLVSTFVPVSRFCYERLREAGIPETKLTLIRNALSRRAIRDRSEREIIQLVSSRPTILAVGQIAPFKGTHLVIDATLDLLARGVDVQTIVLGALPEWPPNLVEYADELRARVARAGADDRVHFVGLHEDVLAIMRAAYVLAAPILQEETFGNVLLEAKHAGLPAVTFARGGLTEQIRHGETGYLCSTHDVAGLLEGLTYFLTQPAERARISAESLVEVERTDSDHQPAEFASRWLHLFEQRTRVAP